MNTRTKIVQRQDLGALLNSAPAMLVIGTFDPLFAAHAARLTELAAGNNARVIVAVFDQPNTVLSLDARQEMAAALAVVDFVLPHGTGLETAYPWTAIHDDTALHNLWSASFKEHV